MTLADDLGISEQELQDSINLERLYNLVSKVKDRCTRCGSSPIVYVNTDKLELLCDACGNKKPHCKRIGATKLRSSELDKLERKFGKQSTSHYTPAKSIRASEGDSRKKRSKKKKRAILSSSDDSSESSESTDEKSTISSDTSSDHKRKKKGSKGKKKKGSKGRTPASEGNSPLSMDPWGMSQEQITTPPQHQSSSPIPGIVGMLQQQQRLPYSGGGIPPMGPRNPYSMNQGFYNSRPMSRPVMRPSGMQQPMSGYWNTRMPTAAPQFQPSMSGNMQLRPRGPQMQWQNPVNNPFQSGRQPARPTPNPFLQQRGGMFGNNWNPQMQTGPRGFSPFGGGQMNNQAIRGSGTMMNPASNLFTSSGFGGSARNPFFNNGGQANVAPRGLNASMLGGRPNFTTSQFYGEMQNQAAISGTDIWRGA